MDIAAMSTVMSQSSLSQAVSLKVLNLAKDSAVQQGQQLVQMMNQSLDPNLGNTLDIKI
jgi:hypothetical protein